MCLDCNPVVLFCSMQFHPARLCFAVFIPHWRHTRLARFIFNIPSTTHTWFFCSRVLRGKFWASSAHPRHQPQGHDYQGFQRLSGRHGYSWTCRDPTQSTDQWVPLWTDLATRSFVWSVKLSVSGLFILAHWPCLTHTNRVRQSLCYKTELDMLAIKRQR